MIRRYERKIAGQTIVILPQAAEADPEEDAAALEFD
jgi:hypothetical protein